MKISKISFKNIHSLRGEHHIDFCSGPLAEGGLFAITGATGSGKSTLLDVITLALYNRIPRMDGTISKSVIDGEGGIMTRNAQDCYAEVEYIVNGKIYRSHWAIERNRNNNLNDRKQEITDVDSGEIIESGKSAVPNKNQELIGLSYDQFVKAMVLSQGEFSKLLKAPRDQRNKLLEDITGAKDYRAIGIAVYKRFKNATDACKEQEIRLSEIELLNEETKQNLIAEELTLNASKISQKKMLDDLKVTIEHQKGIQKSQKRLEENTTLQNQLAKELEHFAKEECLLEKHAKYAVHSGLITSYEQHQKDLHAATEDLKKQEAQSVQILKNKTLLLNEATSLLQKPATKENYQIELNKLRQQVLALKNEEALAENEVKLHEQHIKSALVEVNRKSNRLPFDPNPKSFFSALAKTTERVENFLVENTNGLASDIEEKEAQVNKKLELITDLKLVLTQYCSELKIKQGKEQDLTKCTESLQKYGNDLKRLETELKLLEVEVEQLSKAEERRKKHQSLEAHRDALVEGEPCPLCGALEHPYALQHPIHDLQADVLKSKIEILTTKSALKTATQTNLDNERKNSKTLNNAILTISETVKPQLKTIESLCGSLEVATMLNVEDVVILGEQLSKELKIIGQVKEANSLKTLLLNIEKTASLWSKSLGVKTTKVSERKKLYAGNDIETKVQDMLTKWTANIENQTHIQSLISASTLRIKDISANHETLKQQLLHIIQIEGIATIADLKKSILPETAAEAIRQKKQILQLKQERLNSEREIAMKEMDEFKKLVTTTQSLPELEITHSQLEHEFAKLNEKIGSLKAQLEADQKAKEKQQEFLRQLKALKKDEALWKTMNDLIGDATGKKFSNFVQDLTLEQLIGYTNLRLKDLSDRYLLDIPTAEEGSKNDSLKVFDRHQGDGRRSINTLSGGETFMVSLAMAFALSDLAAKNVKIESIFIDEGFGTLDPETLNQAITILEKMQNEGDKSIGVISHVEALKERITTQIRLEKTGAGYSTIEII